MEEESMQREIRVIIPAGGSGTRLGKRKQFELFGNKRLFLFTLERLLRAIRLASDQVEDGDYVVRNVVISVPEEDIERAQAFVESEFDRMRHPDISIRLVTGGETRAVSVQKAFDALDAREGDVIVVHDACRPFPDVALLRRLLVEFEKPGVGCVIPSLPVTDTLKQWIPGEHPWVREAFRTVPRDEFFTVQTPQLLRFEAADKVYHYKAHAFVRATDDASVAEALGFRVTTVEGSTRNMKITSAEDLALAAYILQGESQSNTD